MYVASNLEEIFKEMVGQEMNRKIHGEILSKKAG